MVFHRQLHNFVMELRQEGLPISQDELVNCYRALLLVDWEWESSFYAALAATLLKDSSYRNIFHRVYRRFFFGDERETPLERLQETATLQENGSYETSFFEQNAAVEAGGAEGLGEEGTGGKGTGSAGTDYYGGKGKKELLQKDFTALTSEEIRVLQELVPLLKRRLISKMIRKRKKEKPGALDYRRTFRQSLSTGGAPLDLFTLKRTREKPVIFALCDVSSSVWEFSYFSLALVHSLEQFFRHVRSFAFVDEIDEITGMLEKVEPHALRSLVFKESRVVIEGRTNYGFCLRAFWERYKRDLTPQSYLLIFGDARNNWFSSESHSMASLASRVKRVFWFNPEKKQYWNTGDSAVRFYQSHCHRFLSCPNLQELEKALAAL